MNAACKAITYIMASCCLIFIAYSAKAQAKFAVGAGPALNYSKENKPGFGFVTQGEIKMENNFSLIPSLGLEVPYLAMFGLAGRYYPANRVYLDIGVFVNFGGGDGYGDKGGGATGGLGFMLLYTKHNVIDLNLHYDIMNFQNKVLNVAGFRLTYNYSFTTLK